MLHISVSAGVWHNAVILQGLSKWIMCLYFLALIFYGCCSYQIWIKHLYFKFSSHSNWPVCLWKIPAFLSTQFQFSWNSAEAKTRFFQIRAFVCFPLGRESQLLPANRSWLQLEADWWTVPDHSCELNVSLRTHSCCTEPFFFSCFFLWEVSPACSPPRQLLASCVCQGEEVEVAPGDGHPLRWRDWWAGATGVCKIEVVLAVRKRRLCWRSGRCVCGSARGLAPILNLNDRHDGGGL